MTRRGEGKRRRARSSGRRTTLCLRIKRWWCYYDATILWRETAGPTYHYATTPRPACPATSACLACHAILPLLPIPHSYSLPSLPATPACLQPPHLPPAARCTPYSRIITSTRHLIIERVRVTSSHVTTTAALSRLRASPTLATTRTRVRITRRYQHNITGNVNAITPSRASPNNKTPRSLLFASAQTRALALPSRAGIHNRRLARAANGAPLR